VRSAGGGLVHAHREAVWRRRHAQQQLAAVDRNRWQRGGVFRGMEDARAYATWAAMEREFALGGSAGGARLLLPRHSRLRFLELIEWMVISEACSAANGDASDGHLHTTDAAERLGCGRAAMS
jgi:hypothetical protein